MISPTVADVRTAAICAQVAGLCVLPPRQDGTKHPLQSWTEYEKERPTREQVRTWYRHGRMGLGVVTGAVSGNLELFEFDDYPTYLVFKEAARVLGIGLVVNRVEAGYCEGTPNDGIHWLIRCVEIAGNTALARRPGPPDEHGRPTVEKLIETRGEGGYAILAPSFGSVHPSGKPYRLLHGSFGTIARVTPDERRALWDLARSFDQMPIKEPTLPRPTNSALPPGDRPGDLFAAKVAWDAILEPHGWTLACVIGDTAYWRRPGKERGWSATTNHAGSGLLYVFSSSTPFEPERGYGKFSAYTVLNHSGDFMAAARALARTGYRAPEPRLRVKRIENPWHHLVTSSGREASLWR